MARLNPPASWSQRLERLDSSACSDAMDRLGITGVAAGLRGLTVPLPVTGPVLTVELGAADRAPAAGRHLGTAAIEAALPGDVIVVAAAGRLDAAAWGGLLSIAAAARQVSGVIVDGACRDVDETLALGLPIYARGTIPATARGRQIEVAWNGPVWIAGVLVNPGDLVIADGSGVVFLPADKAPDIILAAEEIVAREAAMAERIRAGEPVSRVMSADYEDLLNAGRDGH